MERFLRSFLNLFFMAIIVVVFNACSNSDSVAIDNAQKTSNNTISKQTRTNTYYTKPRITTRSPNFSSHPANYYDDKKQTSDGLTGNLQAQENDNDTETEDYLNDEYLEELPGENNDFQYDTDIDNQTYENSVDLSGSPDESSDDIEENNKPSGLEFDFEGATLTMFTLDEPFVKGMSRMGDIVLDEIERLKLKYNFNLKWQSKKYTDIRENFPPAAMAGIHYGDIIYTNRKMAFPSWTKNKFIIPLDDYIDFTRGPYSNNWQKVTEWDGQHYGINLSPTNIPLYLMTYNKDIIAREGITDLFELQQRGEWTWDVMLEVAKKTTVDKDGDGFTDQWGIDGNYENFINNLIISNNADFLIKSNDKTTFGLTQPRALKALQFASEIYNYYKVAQNNKENYVPAFISGNAAMYVDRNFDGAAAFPPNCGLLQFPKGPDANDYITMSTGGVFLAIPATTKNPEVVAAIMAEIWDAWDVEEENHVSESELFLELINKHIYGPNDIITCKEAATRQHMLTHINYEGLEDIISDEIYVKIIEENMPVVTVIESYKDSVQAVIDGNIR